MSTKLPNAANVIWQWNGINVSQFGDGLGAPTVSNGATTGTLTAGTVGGAGSTLDCNTPALIYTHAGGAANPLAYYAINDLPVLPPRYVIEARIGPRNLAPQGANTSAEVLLWFQDSTHNMRLRRTSATPTNIEVITGNGNDGRTVASQGIDLVGFANIDEGQIVRVMTESTEPGVGQDPRGIFWIDTFDNGIEQRLNNGTWGAIGGGIAPSTAWDAGWRTGGTVRRPGIVFAELNATAGSGFIAGLRILNFML